MSMFGGDKNCAHAGKEYAHIIKANGAIEMRLVCMACGAQGFGVKKTDVADWSKTRLIHDYRFTVPPCAVCGVRGSELHHWAPRALFPDEADLWPTCWLCPACHARWHRVTKTA